MQVKKRSLVSWIVEFAGEKKGHFLGSIILAVLGVAASFVPYLIIAGIVRNLISSDAGASWYLKQVILMGICWIVRVALHSVSTSLSHIGTFNVLKTVRQRVTEKLTRIPLGSVLDSSSGSYKNIIVERIDSMETTLAHVIPEFSANILLPAAMFVYLLIIDWRLGLANLISVVIGICFAAVMMYKSQGSYEVAIEKTKKLNDTAVEYINGIEVIKVFSRTGSSYEKFVRAAKEGADCFIEWMRRCIWWQAGTLSFMPATLLGVLPVGLLLVKNGSLSAADFISGIVLSSGLVTPLVIAFSYYDDILKMGTIFGEAIEILEREEMIRPEQMTVQPENCSIELKDVRFSYKDKEVLHGINMKFEQNRVTAIVGPSGSGKTTIVRLIDSLWDPSDGAVTFGNVNIRNIPLRYYMKQISYVSQDNYLFDLSIMENIRLGKSGASDEEVIEAAKRSGCHEFILSLENGYDTVVGSGGGHLSGGERQRICIARAMLKDAPVIILDEATSYTDPENEALVQTSIARLIKGKTLIIIAHRLSTIQGADCIYVVNDGMIEASGTHSQLLESCELYRRMWQAHIGARDRDDAGKQEVSYV